MPESDSDERLRLTPEQRRFLGGISIGQSAAGFRATDSAAGAGRETEERVSVAGTSA